MKFERVTRQMLRPEVISTEQPARIAQSFFVSVNRMTTVAKIGDNQQFIPHMGDVILQTGRLMRMNDVHISDLEEELARRDKVHTTPEESISLHTLEQTIHTRRTEDPSKSYTAQLHAEGIDGILEKVREEAYELSHEATRSTDDFDVSQFVSELADFTYFNLVLIAYQGVTLDEVLSAARQQLKGKGEIN